VKSQNGHPHVPADEVAASLGEGWVEGSGSLYEKLARSLQGAIDDGHLPGGTYLPSERMLAHALFVSRSTVVAAYRLLREQRALASRRGSGTWVQGRASGSFSDDEALSILARDPYLSNFIDSTSVPIDLTLPAPRAALERITSVLLYDGMGASLLAEATPLGYQPRGLRSYRRFLARYLGERGLPTTEDELLITNGGQQAISLLISLFLRPKDEVIVENPSYRGLIDALIFSRARVLPLSIDSPQLPSRLHQLAIMRAPRLIYLTPTCHNPTGLTLDLETRREIVRIAGKLGIPIIEDTVLADLSLEEPPRHLATLSRTSTSVIVVGSLSKVIWGGLRVGWIRATPSIISRLARLKAVADMGTSAISQLIALELMRNHVDGIIRTQKDEVHKSLALIEQLLATHTPEWQWRRPSGGRSMWIRLPRGQGGDFTQFALLHGVAVSAGPTLSFDESFSQHIRLQFVQRAEELQEGARRLGDAWNAYLASLGDDSSRVRRPDRDPA
jgi:DNA-binding transcriptional MocR family regulator